MSVAIIISTHGTAAEQLLNATEIILGKQKNVAYINFFSYENVEILVDKFKAKIIDLYIKSGLLFLVDFWGGSPFNAANQIKENNKDFQIISGINIPMLTEIFMIREESSSITDLIKIAIEAGRDGIRTSYSQKEYACNNNYTSIIKSKLKKTINHERKNMIIALTRIDDRLIHGQVVTSWTKETKIKRIIVINDEIANNEIRKKLLIQVSPPGITAHVISVAKAIRVYFNTKYANDRVMLLLTNPTDILKLIEGGVIINTVNIGGMAFHKGKTQINNFLSVDKKDIEAFKKLNNFGIELEVRKVFSDYSLNIMDLIKDFINKI